MRAVIILTAVSLLAPQACARDEKAALAEKAMKLLQTYCSRCHGDKGSVEGGVNYVLDRARLVSRKKVVPGEPAKSRLLRRIADGEMPPEGEKRPSKEEVEVLRRWVTAGAPDFDAARPARPLLAPAKVSETIAADLGRFPERERRLKRYFTFTHLYNAGVSEGELETHRQALSKLLNSLSWHRTITPPTAVDTARTVYRIDLRDYRWNDRTWIVVSHQYPYGVTRDTDAEKSAREWAAAVNPAVRGDWFVANAALPPLYHQLLNLPMTDRALEAELRVRADDNVRGGDVLRAGFNGSGVSRNNRLIERHESLWGAYWKSYDFAAATGRQNLFSSPLGPDDTASSFRHDGGEIIFALPNGLFAYLLTDAAGRRIDTGPIRVVSDPRRPDRTVVNGLSCMSCHARGIIPKEDQVREAVLKNRKAFKPAEVEDVLALYPPKEKMLRVMKEDAERFLKAVEKAGCRTGTTEPIVAVAVRFEGDLDLESAASELGVTAAELKKKIETSFFASKALGALAAGGAVPRRTFEGVFAQLVNDLELGKASRPIRLSGSHRASPSWLDRQRPWSPGPGDDLPRPTTPTVTAPRPDAREPFIEGLVWRTRREGHLQLDLPRHPAEEVRALAASPADGRLAIELDAGLIGVLDPAVPGKAVRLEGHKGNVAAVTFSADGKLLASGGEDKTARVWDAATGKELVKVGPLRSPVRAVRFSPDGKWLATGGDTIDLWDAGTGKHVRKCELSFGNVRDLAFSPDGSLLASVGRDARLWSPATGKVQAFLRRPRGAVLSAAFSPDGKWLAVGVSDGTVHLWDTKEKAFKLSLDHREPVNRVAFSADSKKLLSAGGRPNWRSSAGEAVRAWDLETASVVGELKGHGSAVTNLAVSHDGKKVVTAGWDRSVRVWDMPRPPTGPFQGHLRPITALAASADGKLIVTGSADKSARLWDASGKPLQRFLGHPGDVQHVVPAPDGKRVFTVSDRSLFLWDAATAEQLRRWELPEPPAAVALSADGKLLALCSFEGALRLLNFATDEVRDRKAARGVRTIAFSPDGRRLAVAGLFDKAIRIWDVAAGKEVAALGDLTAAVMTIAYSPDGKLLASAGSDRDVRLWDVEKGGLARRLEGHESAVFRVAFSRDGSKVYSASGGMKAGGTGAKGRLPDYPVDCSLRTWEVATGKQLKAWGSFPYPIGHLALDDGERHALLVYNGLFYRQPLDQARTAKEVAATPK